MKRAASWCLCFVLASAFLAGCGMFGDSRLYTGLLALCARCHAGAEAPAKTNAIPGAAGMQGSAGKSGGFRCDFTMDHVKGVKP